MSALALPELEGICVGEPLPKAEAAATESGEIKSDWILPAASAKGLNNMLCPTPRAGAVSVNFKPSIV